MSGAASRTDVDFPGHGGTTLRGWLYRPPRVSTDDVTTGVVMAHGFSAVKEMRLDRYAEVFAAAGMTVLVYDHRNFGASDGEPRHEINPWAQARDYQAAITWLAAHGGVDGTRIGIWGSSFSGGEALVVGACDRRVRAVVANVPFAGLPGVDYGDADEVTTRFERLRDALADVSGEGPADRRDTPFGPMAVVCEPGDDRPAFLPQDESSEYFLPFGPAGAEPTTWRNDVTVVSLLSDPLWDPGVAAAHVAPTPLLMVVATDDRLADTAIAVAAAERAGPTCRLELLEGHHFIAYEGEGFDRSSTAAVEHFVANL